MNKVIQWINALRDQESDIIFDFEVRDEAVYIRLLNNSNFELFDVQCEFSETILGFGGEKKISDLNVFKQLSYMVPNKEFLIYVDEIDAFFANLKNELITISISSSRRNSKRRHTKIVHNLSIYKDLLIIHKTN